MQHYRVYMTLGDTSIQADVFATTENEAREFMNMQFYGAVHADTCKVSLHKPNINAGNEHAGVRSFRGIRITPNDTN